MTTSLSVIIAIITFAFLFAWIIVEVIRFNKKTEIPRKSPLSQNAQIKHFHN